MFNWRSTKTSQPLESVSYNVLASRNLQDDLRHMHETEAAKTATQLSKCSLANSTIEPLEPCIFVSADLALGADTALLGEVEDFSDKQGELAKDEALSMSMSGPMPFINRSNSNAVDLEAAASKIIQGGLEEFQRKKA